MATILDAEAMSAALRELGELLGRTPTSTDMDKYRRETGKGAFHSSYFDHFGTWDEALAAAGLGPSKYANSWSNEEICEYLRNFAKKIGHTPLRQELDAVKDERRPCSQTCCDRFGSWKSVLMAAGLVEEYHYRRETTDEEMLELLQRLADVLGREPSARDPEKYDWMPSYSAYCNRFGRWSNAKKLAGFVKAPKPQKKKQTLVEKAELRRKKAIKSLKAFIDRFERLPTTDDLGRKTNTPCYRTCISIFGSWEAMITFLCETV